jgi:TAG lipase / lysophosphatidylethanolamine acyltransferase
MFRVSCTLYAQVVLSNLYLTVSGLLRNLGNITAKNLYNHGYAGYSPSTHPFSKFRTKLLIEDYISETTSALLYLFSLPSPNSQASSFPQPDTFVPQITSICPTTHHSPTFIRPPASSSDSSAKSVLANAAPLGFSSNVDLNPTLSFQEKKYFFLQSRQTFGFTALVLQGGSVFGLCHVGVVRGLWKRGLLPRILVGWGVGGLIASLGFSFPNVPRLI